MPNLSIIPPHRNIRYAISVFLIIETIYAFYNRGVWIDGHFDNPAGFAMFVVASFPFMYYIDYVRNNSYIRHSVEILFLAIMIATGSRAGIIALIFIIVLAYYKNRGKKYNIRIKTTAAAFICIVFIILYLLKKDSANGRVLIWICTCRMIEQKPIFGYGVNGFRKNYMNFQQQYFAENPNSIYANLADNIVHPFNEYLQIIVNYGFAGFSILIIFIVILLYISKKKLSLSCYPTV